MIPTIITIALISVICHLALRRGINLIGEVVVGNGWRNAAFLTSVKFLS
jgi:hypothetical protein